ncbi:MAG: hypothetical protein Q9195_003443 [Heterodermia aff. obscurata]
MGIQKKHGKGRLDKWYKLAKEKGYRARAAFKLIQLNRRYGFLEKSKVLLDLCAAPGSWCQVAAETMPTKSLIIGVDLTPIKPIPRTITFQSDITTDKCRAIIRQHLKTWKADTVLHDGAPNVGIAWVQDAFSQAELALKALRLAIDFLVEGGTFVTKVFRSKDYNALLWVFNQLFTKVEATKPPSSRNVSAEIFVVCRGFKAPKWIDPKFLDPRSVFAELTEPTPNNEAKVFNPEKKKRKREGYEEGDYIQFKEATASEFVQTTDPIAMLGTLNRISFVQSPQGDIALAALDRLPESTKEVRDCCRDLKVLGRKEFRLLLRWRLKAREIFGFSTKKQTEEDKEDEQITQVLPMDEELRIQEEMQQMNERESSRQKRERKRENERKQKEIVRMQLHMTMPKEIGLEQAGPNGEDSMFTLAAVDRAGMIEQVTKGKMAIEVVLPKREASKAENESDPEEDGLDRELDELYGLYQERKSASDAKHRAKKSRKEHEDGDWEGFSDLEEDKPGLFEAENSDSTDDDAEKGEQSSPNLRDYPSSDEAGNGLSKRASTFFQQDIFKDMGDFTVDDPDDSAIDLESEDDRQRNKPQTVQLLNELNMGRPHDGGNNSLTLLPPLSNEAESRQASESGLVGQITASTFKSDKAATFKAVQDLETTQWARQDIDIITAEAMTLAQQIASGEKSKHDLVDDGFNKYAFHDRDGLPEWFLDDEGKHNKPHRPISAAGAAAIKEKLRALNARPIKKVREAKDRKRFKAAQRLAKLRKKSALVADDEAISEKEKAQNIAKLMSKAVKKKPKQRVKLVVAKGGNRGIPGRPRGVKGKYKIVDARLKKDVRAEKRVQKR